MASTVNSGDMFKDCLSRNKYISSLMRRYSEKYKTYKSKPECRRNRNPLEYCPTTQETIQMSRVYRNEVKFWRASPSPDKKFRVMRNRASVSVEPHDVPNCELLDFNYHTREEIIGNAFTIREKCKLSKILIGKHFDSRSP
jgi:hypothetical protein